MTDDMTYYAEAGVGRDGDGTVCLILVDHLRGRRWKEAAVAASVVAIMALSAVLGKK